MPIYMQLPDGFEGEAVAEGFVNWHELNFYEFPIIRTPAASASFPGISVSLNEVKCDSKFMFACAAGENLGTATIVCEKPNGSGKTVKYLTYTLENVMISSFDLSDSPSAGEPALILNLTFSKITMKCTFERLDGTLHTVENYWDLVKNNGK